MVGGEHIWKCGEVVPNDDLRELIQEWRYHKGVDGRTASIFEMCADDLEDLL
jgi:hypothetical protein